MKYLKILFFILIIVVLAEGGYYLYAYTKKNRGYIIPSENMIKDQTAAGCGDTISPTSSPQFVDTGICAYIQDFPVSEDRKVKLLYEVTGTLENISYNYELSSGRVLALKFTLVGTDGNVIDSYGFREEEIGNTLHIYRLVDDRKIEVTKQDLREGTRVKFITIEDARVLSDQTPEPVKNEIIIL